MAKVTESAAAQYQRDGFFLAPTLIPPELAARAALRMDAIVDGEYETGVEPHMRHFSDADPPDKIRKIDNAHLSDDIVYEVVSHPAVGRFAAELLDAKMVQVWATQLLVKPPAPDASRTLGNVGWHQDNQYWTQWWDGEVFTAWVAISDVTSRAGCMRFVRGSHDWGFLDQGDFFGGDLDGQRAAIAQDGREWEEVAAILPPGGVSFHHRLTYHGSGPNLEPWPRLSFALHMRTERSTPKEGQYYTEHLDDPRYAPVIFEA